MQDSRKKRLDTYINNYKKNKNKYGKYSKHILDMVERALEIRRIPVAYSSAREKDIDSLINKCNKKIENKKGKQVYKYTDFYNQIMDLAGVRIVTYLVEDIEEVSKAIRELFVVIEKHSGNKLDLLGADKIGYLSMHFIVMLNEEKMVTGEEGYKGLKCEIQIRTVLEDAWAQIFHDRQYKNNSQFIIPEQLVRRINLLSGSLELLDYEINEVVKGYEEVDEADRTKQFRKILEQPISKESLSSYINIKFGKSFAFYDYEHIKFMLDRFGIKNIRALDAILQDMYFEDQIKNHLEQLTVDKIINYMLIIKDSNKFLENMEKIVIISSESYDFLTKFIDIDSICKKGKIKKENRR